MRVAILTDIHANLPALEAVLDACTPYDAVWVMGDIVGYGPYPDDVVARLRKEQAVAVRGNHDAAVLGDLDTSVFNEDARLAVEWTADRIGTVLATLAGGSAGDPGRGRDFTLAHGSPRDPLWEYLITVPLARRNFSHFQTRHAIVGHTHVPRVFRDDGGHIEVIAPRRRVDASCSTSGAASSTRVVSASRATATRVPAPWSWTRRRRAWSGCASHIPWSGCRRGCAGPACRRDWWSGWPTACDRP